MKHCLCFMISKPRTIQSAQDTSFKHAPNMTCVQQLWAVCEDDTNVEGDCQRCVKRNHSLWTHSVGELFPYVFKSRSWAERILTISCNDKAFELHFVLNLLVRMKLLPELLIMKVRIPFA